MQLFQIHQNPVNPTCTGLERCWIITHYLHWPQVAQVIFCCCSNTLVVQLNQRSIPFGYFLHLLVQCHQGPLVFSGVFIAKAVGVQAKGSGDITTIFMHTLLDLLEYIIDICQSHWQNFFSCKKQKVWSWDYSLQVLDYQDFQIIGFLIKPILLHLVFVLLWASYCSLYEHKWFQNFCLHMPTYKNDAKLM